METKVCKSCGKELPNSATPEELYNFCKNILRYSPNYIEKENVESENKESQR